MFGEFVKSIFAKNKESEVNSKKTRDERRKCMSKWIPLEEVMKHQEKYHHSIKRPIEYYPDHKSTILKGTGCEDQTAGTEEYHSWHAISYNRNILLVARDVTEFELKLEGEEGCENGVLLQETYARLYGSREMHAYGIPATKDLILALPNFLQCKCESFWTVTRTNWCDRIGLVYAMGTYNGKPTFDFIVPYSSASGGKYSLRPIVQLPHGILADVDGNFNRPLKIVTKNMLLK